MKRLIRTLQDWTLTLNELLNLTQTVTRVRTTREFVIVISQVNLLILNAS